jgi:hypothetical protein
MDQLFKISVQQFSFTNFVISRRIDWYSQTNVEAMTRMLLERKVTMSQPSLVPNPDIPVEVEEAEYFCEFYGYYIPPRSTCMEPMATIYYPLFPEIKVIHLLKYTTRRGILTSTPWTL